MEINKCSKCGGEAEHIKLWKTKRQECFIRCKGCGRETKVYASKQGAVDAWNSGKVTITKEEMIDLLRKRAEVGRMEVRDKLLMLEAADRLEMLSDDVAELTSIVDLRSKRKWYTKFVKEVYQKIPGNELSDPDFDYIYEQYFKLTANNERLAKQCGEIIIECDERDAERLKQVLRLEAANAVLMSDAFATTDYAIDKIREARAEAMRSLKEAFVLHFGTYTVGTKVKLLDVFKLLDRLVEEQLNSTPK